MKKLKNNILSYNQITSWVLTTTIIRSITCSNEINAISPSNVTKVSPANSTDRLPNVQLIYATNVTDFHLPSSEIRNLNEGDAVQREETIFRSGLRGANHFGNYSNEIPFFPSPIDVSFTEREISSGYHKRMKSPHSYQVTEMVHPKYYHFQKEVFDNENLISESSPTITKIPYEPGMKRNKLFEPTKATFREPVLPAYHPSPSIETPYFHQPPPHITSNKLQFSPWTTYSQTPFPMDVHHRDKMPNQLVKPSTKSSLLQIFTALLPFGLFLAALHPRVIVMNSSQLVTPSPARRPIRKEDMLVAPYVTRRSNNVT